MPAPPSPLLPWPELARGEPGAVYGIISAEPFLLSEALRAFYECEAFGPNRELNIQRFVAGETGVGRVVEAARSLPMLGSRRLVVLLEVQQLPSKDHQLLITYLNEPTPTTTLVLAGSRLDMRTRLARALKSAGRLHTIPRIYPDKLPGWVQQRARMRGKRLQPKAAEVLAELAGAGLGALDMEIEKLCIYAANKAEITLEDVRLVVGRTPAAGIFELTDAVAAGQLARAMEAWAGLKATGQAPAVVLNMLVRLAEQMLRALELSAQGVQGADLARALGLPMRAARTIAKAAKDLGEEGIREMLRQVVEAEGRLKRGEARNWVVEGLVLNLCGQRPGQSKT